MNPAYIKHPLLAKISQRVSLSARYICVLIVGIICLGYLSANLTAVGIALIVLSVLALYGTISGRYRWEWITLAPMAGTLAICAVLLYPVTVGMAVMLLIALVFALIDRLITLTFVAKTLRDQPSIIAKED